MKAIQTRSPIHLAYEYANLNNVIVSIWINDTVNIDSTTTPDYQLNSQAINDFATVEISELIRSKNDYIFNPDFYEKRDTAKYVLIRGELLDSSNSELEVKYDFLRVRDGYLRRVDGVTEKELPQIYKNIVPTDIRDWNINFNTTITGSKLDPFGGSDAYLVNDTDDSLNFALTDFLDLKGVYTLSVWLRKNSPADIYTLIINNFNRVDFDISNNVVTLASSNIISYDIFRIGNYVKVSICYDFNLTDFFRIASREESLNAEVFIFNPKITKGNIINHDATDLVLQDNTVLLNDSNITQSFMVDRKIANTVYAYDFQAIGGFFSSNPNSQSFQAIVSSNGNDLIYDQLNSAETRQRITLTELDECKHTPTKVSFINRFGVIQDLVFFKKRTDNIDTDKESYKTNVLQQGNYYPHIGQNQTIRKESKRSVTLNTGFYSEEFNTVFEQLQNSLHYWIDDEPAVLEGSSFNVKTRVNDKLINYTFDFSYSNEEVNTI